jgi:hypothetical protein
MKNSIMITSSIKMKTKTKSKINNTLSEQFQNQIATNVEIEVYSIHLTHIHDCSLSWLGTGTSI